MESNISIEELKDNYQNILEKAQNAVENAKRNFEDIKIIAVSKTKSVEIIELAHKAGIKILGENYTQEILDKASTLKDKGYNDLEWHFIGHLQTNKVKFLAPFISKIHSVSSVKLAKEISNRAKSLNRNIDILIQINTSGEQSKSGVEPDSCVDIAGEINELENINIEGLMTIGTYTEDQNIQIKEFSLLRKLLDRTNQQLATNWNQLSMGMSHDFELAISEGATMVRVGTAIFGARVYNK